MELDFKVTDLGLWLKDSLTVCDGREEVSFDDIKRRAKEALPHVDEESLSFKRLAMKLLGTKLTSRKKHIRGFRWNQAELPSLEHVVAKFHQKQLSEHVKSLMKTSANGLSIVIELTNGIVSNVQTSYPPSKMVQLPILCDDEAQSFKVLRRLWRSKPCTAHVSPSCELLLTEFTEKDTCDKCVRVNRKRRHDEKTQVIAGVNASRRKEVVSTVGPKFQESIDRQLKIGSSKKIIYDQHTISRSLRRAIQNPKGYREARASGEEGRLPCERQLRKYKNCVPQLPGVNEAVISWINEHFEDNSVGEYGRSGGLLIDEMSIQPGVSFDNYNQCYGYTMGSSVTEEARKLFGSLKQPEIADKVCQVVFATFDGATFPFGYWPCHSWTSSDILSTILECIECLAKEKFKVRYVSADGAATNRSAFKRCLAMESARVNGLEYTIQPVGTEEDGSVTFIMDIKHCFKKVRNNLLKSKEWTDEMKKKVIARKEAAGKKNAKATVFKSLRTSTGTIVWQLWERAYEFNANRTWRLHPKLTRAHVDPAQLDKMRNHLAEEVLNRDMLYLMKEYGLESGADVAAAVELLEITSPLIEIFKKGVIKYFDAECKDVIKKAISYFESWNKISSEETGISQECFWDMNCCLKGILELVAASSYNIQPGYINSDLVELHFSQVRELFHNQTPTVQQYKNVQNSIILGQPVAKLNAKTNTISGYIKPLSMYK